MTTLLVAEIAEYAGRDLSVELQILGPEFEVRRFTYSGSKSDLIAACVGADCILTDFTPFPADVIARLNDCKLISVAATGFGCIDIDAATDANIRVCAIDEYCTQEVADHTLLLVLALARKLRTYDRQVQRDRVWQFDTTDGLWRLEGKTLGLIGFGRIGQAVAKRAAGFGINVITYDPNADAHIANDMNVRLCDLEALLTTSDIISLHCAATFDNHHLIDQEAFGAMQKKPMLINVARGTLIDEKALVDALDSGQISGVGLDVLESESPDLLASGLLGRDNALLTPHTAFYSDDAILDCRRISAANIRHWFDGEHQMVRKYIHPVQ